MATLERKLMAITCRTKMGLHIMFDDGDVQITLKGNDYIKKDPYYSGWHGSIESAADAAITAMETVMRDEMGGDCLRRFREFLCGAHAVPNGEVRGASRLAGEASSREAATSTVVLEGGG